MFSLNNYNYTKTHVNKIMAKKYKLNDGLMPRKPSFLKLDYADLALLNSGKSVELKKVPTLAKDYLEEVKQKIKKEVK